MAGENNVSEDVLCFVCNKPARRKRIYCADCRVWSHVSCADRKKCCEPFGATSTPENQDVNPTSLAGLIDTINSLSSTVAEMKDIMNELITENKKLRKEIEYLKDKEIQTNNIVENTVNEESVIEEAVERLRRSNNVIIRGIQETNDGKEEDGNAVKTLVSSVIPEIQNLQIVTATRLGKYNPSRSRPIKVTFHDSSVVHRVLRSRPKKGIFINKDLTRMQQNKSYTIRKEFRNRLENGEKDIRLKYYNGMPKIVEGKNS